jgi:hypothetical protein
MGHQILCSEEQLIQKEQTSFNENWNNAPTDRQRDPIDRACMLEPARTHAIAERMNGRTRDG